MIHEKIKILKETSQQRYQYRQSQTLFSTFLVTFLILQQMKLFMCHQIVANKHFMHKTIPEKVVSNKREFETIKSSLNNKQPEEIFTVNESDEKSYDEYPMIVPKRSSLLLDRLMVALHRALEKESNKNAYTKNLNDKNTIIETENYDRDGDFERGTLSNDQVYTEDDPIVSLDYDFKDLSSINRATGETLMPQSFQRRSNIGLNKGVGNIGTEGLALLTAVKTAEGISGIEGSGVRANVGGGGRMYWRCYFNAISCF